MAQTTDRAGLHVVPQVDNSSDTKVARRASITARLRAKLSPIGWTARSSPAPLHRRAVRSPCTPRGSRPGRSVSGSRALHEVVRDAFNHDPGMPVPLHRTEIVAADLIHDVTMRLYAPHPVLARRIARLRMLLSDSDGPLYRPGRGSLAAALCGVQAAL